MTRKPRHLMAIESIDRGLKEAEQITIEDGIRAGMKAGRLTQEVGEACLDAYRRGRNGMSLVPDPPAEKKLEPGWSNGVITMRDPVEHGWDLNKPEPPDIVA